MLPGLARHEFLKLHSTLKSLNVIGNCHLALTPDPFTVITLELGSDFIVLSFWSYSSMESFKSTNLIVKPLLQRP